MSREIDQDDDVSLGDLLELARECWHAELHTSMPARVVSYDADAQLADVRPLVQRTVPRVDGGTLLEDLPTIRAVPVLWPGGGGYTIHCPLTAGDDVLLLVSEQDPQGYLESGEASAPIDHRRHHLASAFAVPVVRPKGRRVSGASSSALVLGTDDGSGPAITIDGSRIDVGRNATKSPATADEVRAELVKIQATLDSATTPSGDVVYGTPYTAPVDASSIGASKVRVE